ncbi:hypothetical protein LTR51_005918 [Lithohypha guttulata]|nr:hypothetical protein LTR51_005918 [Lithohypha guttulata]
MDERSNRRTKLAFGSEGWQYDTSKARKADDTIADAECRLANMAITDGALHNCEISTLEGKSALADSSVGGSDKSRCTPRELDPWTLYKPLLYLRPKFIVARLRQAWDGHRAILVVSADAKPRYIEVIGLLVKNPSTSVMNLIEMFDWKDQQANRYLQDAFANEAKASDGQIYLDLYYSKQQNDQARQQRCWVSLTPSKHKYLKTLFACHRDLTDAIDELAPYEALFLDERAFFVGNFHTMAGLRCDKELMGYLADIKVYWSEITRNAEFSVTASFVRELHGRCPRFSQRDHDSFRKALSEDGTLGYLRRDAREHIYQTIIESKRTVPSLFTFFEDLKYVRLCRAVLKRLVTPDKYLPKGSSLQTCFQRLFQTSLGTTIQTDHHAFQPPGPIPFEFQFMLAYWQIWLCAMRYWPNVLCEQGRKVSTMLDKCYQSSSRGPYWSHVARTAIKLGFRSEHILSIASEHQDFVISTGISYPGFTNVAQQVEWERCGVPFQDKHSYDEHSLFIDKLLVPDSQIGSAGTEEDITTMLVRRSLFLRLFPQSASYRQYAPSPSHNQPQSTLTETQSLDAPLLDRVTEQPYDEHMPDMPQHHANIRRRNGDHVSRVTSPYEVVMWHDTQGPKAVHFGTRHAWLVKLEELRRSKYVFYVPRILKIINMSQMLRYRGRSIITVAPKLDHNQIRRAYGIAA